jgi:hypothetical protein
MIRCRLRLALRPIAPCQHTCPDRAPLFCRRTALDRPCAGPHERWSGTEVRRTNPRTARDDRLDHGRGMGAGEAEAAGLERADLRPPGYICDECLRNNCSVANISTGVGAHERPKCSKFLPTTHSRSRLWGLVSFWWWHWLSRFELRRPVLPKSSNTSTWRFSHVSCKARPNELSNCDRPHEAHRTHPRDR